MRRALVLAFLAAALLPLTARAQAIPAAPGGNMSSVVGMPFEVPFYLDMTARSEKLGSFAARIQWNPAVLHLDGGNDGTFGNVTVNEDSLASGVARIAGANPAGVGGMITLGILHLTPLVSQPDTIHLAVTELFAAGSFADLSGSLVVRDGYFCPARGMFGDIDRDGAINSRDALIALSNAVGLDVSAFDISLGDVDANGATNARDALIILSSAVGLPVTTFRVGRLAGGACSSSLPLAIAIVPDTVELMVGQTVAFEARAKDSTGALQTVTDAIWKSGNTAALAVFPDGHALARDTGTVRVTAIRTALDSAQAIVRIVAHRTLQIVDAAAVNARNQLGSAALPFATIAQGIGAAQGGDTVEVRVGRYAESVWMDRQIVLLGDTLPDGTRPLIAPDPAAAFAGVNLVGSGSRQAVNLGIAGFYAAVDMYGPSRVTLRGVKTTGTTYGVVVDSAMGSLRIEASHLVGMGVNVYGDGVSLNAIVDTLVIQGTEISDFGYDGVYAAGADSTAILHSFIHDVGEYGIRGGALGGGCGVECAAPRRSVSVLGPQSPAFVLDSSTVARTYYLVYLDQVRSASFSHNHFSNPDNYGVEVYGNYAGWTRFTGDSIDVSQDWLYAEYLDSLAVDSVWVSSPDPYGYTYDVLMVRLTNTQFVKAQERALEVNFGTVPGGQVFLDNVSVIGDPSCDLCAELLQAYGPHVTASRITGVNLYRGFDVEGDSSFTLTNSLFRHVEYPVEWYGSISDSTSRLTVTGTTFSGFYDAVRAYNGGLVVDSSAFQNGEDEGVYWDGYGRARVTRNSFASVPYAVEVYAYLANAVFTDTIADNVITDLKYEGIYADASDTVPFQILRNAVTCNQAGGTDGYGIQLDYASGVVAGNQVTGCYSGIHVYDDGSPPRVDGVMGNTVSMPGGFTYAGILVEGSINGQIANNTVTGDTTGSSYYGSIAVNGYTGATATIDSNTVTGGTVWGIHVQGVDSLDVAMNTVRNLNSPSQAYSEDYGGISVMGYLSTFARIIGNVVKHVAGNGIVINTSGVTVAVDSNVVADVGPEAVYTTVGGTGIYPYAGPATITRNLVTGARRDGIRVTSGNPLVVTGNNIAGNLPFGLNFLYDGSLVATGNWWGDPNGPRHTCGPDSSSVGDSVSCGTVTFDPYRIAPNDSAPTVVPLGAPRFLARAAGPRAVPMASSASRDAPVAQKARVEAAVSPVKARRALAQAPAPAGLSPAHAQAWQRGTDLRATAAAAAAQRAQARVAREQTRTQERQAQAQRVEQRKAQHDVKLKAKQARQAAVRAAQAAHAPPGAALSNGVQP